MHPFGDARTVSDHTALLSGSTIPLPARQVLVAKCADCHSSQTRWPFYARLAPGSWLVERDVIEGRRHMNLSLWSTYSPEQQQELSAKILHEVRTAAMPPRQYLFLHADARLSAFDLRDLATLNPGADSPATSAPGDPTRGSAVFYKRCTGCHALDADREGPRLSGVYGRRAGSLPGYKFSDGLKNSGILWNDSSLDQWLRDPDTVAPNNNMDFHVPKAGERSDLIAFLRQH